MDEHLWATWLPCTPEQDHPLTVQGCVVWVGCVVGGQQEMWLGGTVTKTSHLIIWIDDTTTIVSHSTQYVHKRISFYSQLHV